jgi:hypothetical protein
MIPGQRSHKLFVVVLLALGVVLALYVRALERTSPVVGNGRLVAPLPRVPVAVDQTAFRELREAIRDHDQMLVTTLMETSKTFSVANNRRVAVLANDQTVAIVQILEGAQEGKTGWVLPSFVHADSPVTTTPP